MAGETFGVRLGFKSQVAMKGKVAEEGASAVRKRADVS